MTRDDIICSVAGMVFAGTVIWAFSCLYNDRVALAKSLKVQREEDITFCQNLKAPDDRVACLVRLAKRL